MAKDLISQIKKTATKKKVDDKKKELVWHPDESLAAHVIRLVEAGHIMDLTKPVFESRRNIVADHLFDLYTKEMWDKKLMPENPRIVVNKVGSQTKDLAFMFVVKFRKDALKNILPHDEDLEEGETPRDALKNMLIEAVGLSADNANKISDEEFEILEVLDLVASFNDMYYGKDPIQKSAATKLLSYITASKGPKVSMDLFTEEEKGIIVNQQILAMKDNFLQRAFMYCDNLEQLRALLRFVKVSLVCQNFEFAVGDESAERNKRIHDAAMEILVTE